MLVFEHIDARNLLQHHAQLGRCPATWAQRCGALLAAVHDVPISAVPSALRARRPSPAFGPALHRPDQSLFTTSSQAVIDLMALIQSDSALCIALDTLAADESSDAFTHQDVRWDNVLLARTAQGRLTGLRLVDWEGAALGDPAWDVGCLFAEYLSHWVGSIPLTTIETVAQHVELATFSLESAQRSIAAAWAGYASSSALGPLDARHRLRRATRYVGYRLLQRALEMDQRSPVVSLAAACHVQIGARILAEPDRAMTELLGFPSADGLSG
jgi:aminoglycoside phosphotransferase (APT) family kinase protein